MFEKYPYTNFHELNLDWLITQVKKLTGIVDDFVAYNKITFSGTWTGAAYPAWTIVDDGNGDGYMSIKPVPANVPLTDTEYWTPVSNYTALYSAFNSRITYLEGKAAAASHAYDDMSAMLADTALEDGDIAYVLGNHAAYDGGEGFWKISATDDPDHYSVSFGTLYAIMIDENVFNLARYPGNYVNDMMDAARVYFKAHRWKHIYLPEPNANHPACGSWYEGNDHYDYFWKVDDPIILDEDCAYATIEFRGSVTAAVDGLEAVLKVSDIQKPEDIYFVGHTVLGGAAYPGVSHIPTHSILVESSARLSFEFLQAGYSDNVITLGGANQNATVEVEIDRAEIGSCYKNAINGVLNNATGIFKCNDLVIQNPLDDNVELIHAEGQIFDWYIGNLQCSASGQTRTGVKTFNIKSDSTTVGPASSEARLYVGFCRTYGDNIGDFDGDGVIYIGTLIASLTDSADKELNLDGAVHFISDYIGIRNYAWTLNNNSVHATFNVRQILPTPTFTGRNIVINGVVVGTGTVVTTTALENAMILDPGTSKLQIVSAGQYYNIN